MPDGIRLAPIIRRLRADLERLVREAQEASSVTTQPAELERTRSSTRAEIAELTAVQAQHLQSETETVEPLPADSHAAPSQEICPICLQPGTELGSYRGKPMCGSCVTLLRGS